MSPELALAQLRDIHLPAEHSIGSSLSAWILPAVVGVSFLLACLLWRNRRQRHWLIQSRQELAEIQRLAARGDIESGWHRLSVLLRRLALLLDPVSGSHALVGTEWLSSLDRMFDTVLFTQGRGRLIATAPYRPAPGAAHHKGETAAESLIRLCVETEALLGDARKRTSTGTK